MVQTLPPFFLFSFLMKASPRLSNNVKSFLALVFTPPSSSLLLLSSSHAKLLALLYVYSAWQSLFHTALTVMLLPQNTSVSALIPLFCERFLQVWKVSGYLTQLRELTGFLKPWSLCMCRLNARVYFLSHAQQGFRGTSEQLYSDSASVSLRQVLWATQVVQSGQGALCSGYKGLPLPRTPDAVLAPWELRNRPAESPWSPAASAPRGYPERSLWG